MGHNDVMDCRPLWRADLKLGCSNISTANHEITWLSHKTEKISPYHTYIHSGSGGPGPGVGSYDGFQIVEQINWATKFNWMAWED